ncbi:MAG: fibronectin type III domain-containing protein [Candidatus Aphodosoma sp.]
MKKHLFLLLYFLIICSISTITAQSSVYFEEDFDECSYYLPNEWKVGGVSNSYLNWKLFTGNNTVAAYNGTKCLVFDSGLNPKGNDGILISPSFNVVDRYTMVSFHIYNTIGGRVKVYLTLDDGATYEENLLDSTIINLFGWEKRCYSLANYIGQNVRLVVVAVSNENNGPSYLGDIYFDNFRVYSEPICATPHGINATAITNNSAFLTWKDDDEGVKPTSYILSVWDENDNYIYYNTPIQIQYGFKSFNLNNLESNTNYNVTVQGDCFSSSRGLSNPSEVYSFKTMCDPIALPYSENFDSYAYREIPECWIVNSVSPNTSVSPYKYYGTSGACFSLYSSNYRSTYFATRAIDHPANDIQIEFMYNAYYYTSIRVGLMTDPNDFSTFDEVAKFRASVSNTWEKITINTSNTQYNDTRNLHVCFIIEKCPSTNDYYFDNLVISPMPNCVEPSDFDVDKVDSASVYLSWNGNLKCSEYQVEVADNSNFVSSTLASFNSTTGVVSGLNYLTEYFVRVRSICGNDTSVWSKTLQFTTSCAAESLPFADNFNGYSINSFPNCWQRKILKMGSASSGNFTPWRINTYIFDTKQGNSMFTASTSSDEHINLLVSPAIYVPATDTYEVLFSMRRDTYINANNCLSIYVNTAPTLEGAVLLDSLSANISAYPIENEGSKMYEYYFDIPLSGTVYVMFESKFFSSGNMYIDDISVSRKVPCRAKISDFSHFVDEYNSRFTLNWRTATTESEWAVDFTITDASTSTVVYEGTNNVVSDSSFTFDYSQYVNLSTTYNFNCFVRGVCGVNDTSIESTYSFSLVTPCSAQNLPVSQSFDGSNFPPLCWEATTLQNSASPKIVWSRTSSSAHGSGAAQFPIADSVTIAMLNSPKLNLTAGLTYQVSFNMLRNTIDKIKNNEGLSVWLSSNPSDTANAIKLCNIHREFKLSPVETSTGFHNYAYTFNVNTTGEYYIIFSALQEGGSAIVIDDVTIEEKPICSKVEVDVINNVSPTHNKVDVTINPNGSTLVVDIAVVQNGTEITDSVLNASVFGRYTFDANNTVATVTGLQPQSSYVLYIRNVCDDANDVVSLWSTWGKSFITSCEPVEIRDSLALIDGFETYSIASLNAQNPCYQYGVKAVPYVKGGLGTYFSQSGTVCNPFFGTKQLGISSISPGYLAYPVHLYPGRTYEVSVYSRHDRELVDPSKLNFYMRKVSADDTEENTKLSAVYEVNHEWNKYFITFTVADEDDYYVGFEFTASYLMRYMVFDEFTIKESNCSTPVDIVVTASTYNSATFSLQGSGSQWEVRICSSKPALNDENPESVVTEFVNNPIFTINNLAPNTDYYCIARSICSNSRSDWSKPIVFSTECYTKTLPYVELFESNEDVRCWSSIDNESSILEYSTYQARYGSASLKLKSVTAISPELNITNLGDCMISGWVYAEQSEPSSVSFGVMVDKYDISTFENVTDFLIEKNNQWVRFIVYLTDLKDADFEDFADAKHLTISSYSDNVYYFDNLEIAYIPTCPKPSVVNATAYNGSDVKVEWPLYGSENSWLVSVNQIVDNEMSWVYDTVVTSNSIVFHNLPSLRYYSFGVKSVCASNDSSEIIYSDPIKAPCVPVSLPYEISFNNIAPDCWNAVYNNVNPSREWLFNNEGYFYAYPYQGNASDTAYLELPEFKLRYSNGVNVEMTGFIQTSFDSIPVRLEYSLDGGASYQIASDNILSRNVLGTTIVNIPQVVPGTIKLRIVAEKHAYCNLYVYGCKVYEVEDCVMPQSVVCSVNDNVANVHINGTGNKWEYVYEKGMFNPDYRTPIVTTQSDVTLNNLDLSSIYYLYVRSVCSQDHSSWAGPFMIKTKCVEPLPYEVDFNNITEKEDILTECYYVYNGRPGNEDGQLDDLYPYVSTDYQSGALSLTSSSEYPIYVVLPEFEAEVTELNMTFDYKNEGIDSFNENLIVGVVDPSNYDFFMPVYLCPITNKISRVNVDFTKLLSINFDYTGFQIAFRYGGNEFDGFYVTIDNINVTKSAKCSYNPELRLSGVSETSVSFNTLFYADSIEVAYCGLGETIAQNPANVTAYSARTITVDNLVNGTIYDFYVRNVCRGTRGEWSGPITVATECNAITITNDAPWSDNLNTISNADYPFPECFTRIMTTTENGVTYPSLVSKNVNGLEMKGENIIALPKFNNNPTNYSVSLFVHGYGDISVGTVNSSNINNFFLAYDASILSTQVRYDIDLSEYSIPGNRIAIKSYDGSDFIIDSIVVYNLGSCYQPRITNINQLADTFVVVAFNMPSSATGYQYLLKTGENETLTTMTSATSELTINGLTPNTNYELSINSVCGNDTSAWSTITFTTSPSALRAPFVIDFESSALNSYFTMTEDSGNKFMIGDGAVAEDVTGMVPGEYGDACLFLSNAGKYTYLGTGTNVSYFFAPVYLAPGIYSLNYQWLSTGEDCCDYGRAFFAPVDVAISHNTLIDGITASTLPDNFIALDGNTKLNNITEWKYNSTQFTIEKGVTMNLVFMWYNDASGNSNTYPLAVNDITLKLIDCDKNVDLIEEVEITESFAKFNVNFDTQNIADSICVTLRNSYGDVVSKNDINISDNITNSQLVEVSDLNNNSTYTIEVFGYCADGVSVPLTYTFKTMCSPFEVTEATPYFEDFETVNNGAYFKNEFDCWAYNQLNGGTMITSATNNGSKVMSLPYSNAASISRPFDFATGTYELSFYATQTFGSGNVVMSVRKRGDNTWSVLSNQIVRDFMEPVVGKLVVTEDAIYDIKLEFDAVNSNGGYLYFDNISFKPSDCIRPSNIRVNNIKSNSADISWTAYTDTHHAIITNAENEVVIDTILTDNVCMFTVSGLGLFETYTVSISPVCSNVDGNAESVSFTTVCEVLNGYRNDFDSYSDFERPSCWTLEAFKVNGSAYVMSDDELQWKVKNVANHRALVMMNSIADVNSTHILYSPEFLVQAGQVLSFDCYNNVFNEYKDSLVVSVVCNDIESLPIAVITAEDINGVWNNVSYSLSTYENQIIRVKFRTRIGTHGSGNQFVAIDNLNVSTFVQGETYDVTLCANNDYTENGFDVPATQLSDGAVNIMHRIAYGVDNNADTLYTANVFVPKQYVTEIYDTICNNEIYNKGLFADIYIQGRYVQKTSSVFGCDSSVVLHLTVVDLQTTLDEVICEGDSYIFGNNVLSQSGTYTDTLIGSCGCDSIVILNLNVIPKYYETSYVVCEQYGLMWNDTLLTTSGRYERTLTNVNGCDSVDIVNLQVIPADTYLNISICQGQTYFLYNEEISEAGDYVKVLINSLGCDSTVHLTLSFTEPNVGEYFDYVCEGDGYYDRGFNIDHITQDTIVSRTFSKLDGCDTIITVHLQFIPTIIENITVTIADGESYEFGGNTLTVAGNYQHRFYSSLGCDSIVNLTLNVTTDVDNAYALPIVVAPNPVYGGQSTFVNREWTAEEQNGMRVEVINAVGQVVNIFTPATYPVEVNGLTVSGVYYIRITSGAGDVYIGRLVVK